MNSDNNLTGNSTDEAYEVAVRILKEAFEIDGSDECEIQIVPESEPDNQHNAYLNQQMLKKFEELVERMEDARFSQPARTVNYNYTTNITVTNDYSTHNHYNTAHVRSTTVATGTDIVDTVMKNISKMGESLDRIFGL